MSLVYSHSVTVGRRCVWTSLTGCGHWVSSSFSSCGLQLCPINIFHHFYTHINEGNQVRVCLQKRKFDSNIICNGFECLLRMNGTLSQAQKEKIISMEEETRDLVVSFYHWFLFLFQQVKESKMQDSWEESNEAADASHLALYLCLEKNTLLHSLLLGL